MQPHSHVDSLAIGCRVMQYYTGKPGDAATRVYAYVPPVPPTGCAYPGDLDKASAHLEVFKELAHRHRWHTDNGDSLYEIACEHLRRVYTTLAERVRW